MKKLLLMTAILFVANIPAFSHAEGTAITGEIADKYFGNCITNTQKEGTMTADTVKKYCACTALNMQKTMTQEDLSSLSSHGDAARPALNKVLISVNGPCMQYPTHDLINKKCMTDTKNPAICSCLSNKMADFMKSISGQMLPKILADNPNIFDPMTPIMETPEFVETQQKIALSCATNPNQN